MGAARDYHHPTFADKSSYEILKCYLPRKDSLPKQPFGYPASLDYLSLLIYITYLSGTYVGRLSGNALV